jgi:hypothetical protein
MSKNDPKNDPKNVVDETRSQPRVAFFLGASMSLGWDLGYDDLNTLGKHARSLVECFDMLESMRRARGDGRVGAGLRVVVERIEREREASRFSK